MRSDESIIIDSEQKMQYLLEERLFDLQKFVFDNKAVKDYGVIQAFVGFAIARHLALKSLTSFESENP